MSLITDKWTGTEYFNIYDFSHIECYVGNAKQSLYYYCLVMGFKPFAYKGPETGNKDFSSYVLKKNKIFIVLTTPINASHKSHKWINIHGDGIYDIAFSVENASDAYKSCLSRGAESAYEPVIFKSDGNYCSSGIKTYGDIIHSFISHGSFEGIWAPGFVELNEPLLDVPDSGIIRIDHVVGNVEENKMNYWRDFYENIFGSHVLENIIFSKRSKFYSENGI